MQMCQLIIDNMVKLDAPAEAYSRFGFARPDQGVSNESQPNILLVMADQLAAQALSIYGNAGLQDT
jgi:hypothetical protein